MPGIFITYELDVIFRHTLSDKHFRQQAKFSAILAAEFLSDKVILSTIRRKNSFQVVPDKTLDGTIIMFSISPIKGFAMVFHLKF